ncbi:MAG: S1C family serine protease [Catonella sp.]|nr:S1C family serine protease [Catonella sp.]MDY6356495.1 S1C family serine protease [Catonella sp.]
MADKDYINERIVPKQKHPVRHAILTVLAVIGLAALFGVVERLTFELTGEVIPSLLGKNVSASETTDKVNIHTGNKGSGNTSVLTTGSSIAVEDATGSAVATSSAVKTDENKDSEAAGSAVKPEDTSDKPSESAPATAPAFTINEEATPEERIKDYTTLYRNLADYANDMNTSVVEVDSVVMGTDWFENPYETVSSTSGYIAAVSDKYAYVLTDYSSIKDASDMELVFDNGFKTSGTLRNYDKDLNIAILAAKLTDATDSEKESLTAVTFSDSHIYSAGAPVVALGSPDGRIRSTVPGVITSAGEPLYKADKAFSTFYTNITVPENGSGVIADYEGNIIGLIDSGSDSKGSSRVIQAADVTDIIGKLINGESIPYIGIVSKDFEGAESATGRTGGVLVDSVVAGSPAEDAGLHSSDIIYELDGENVTSMTEFTRLLNEKKPGDSVKLTIYREKRNVGSEHEIEIIIGDNRGIK